MKYALLAEQRLRRRAADHVRIELALLGPSLERQAACAEAPLREMMVSNAAVRTRLFIGTTPHRIGDCTPSPALESGIDRVAFSGTVVQAIRFDAVAFFVVATAYRLRRAVGVPQRTSAATAPLRKSETCWDCRDRDGCLRVHTCADAQARRYPRNDSLHSRTDRTARMSARRIRSWLVP